MKCPGVVARATTGLILLGCSGTAENEPIGASRAAVLGVDSFLYLRCNATGWEPSDATRLVETSANQWEITFEVDESWLVQAGDQCQLTETNQLNGWGSTQSAYHVNGATLTVPSSAPVASGFQPIHLAYPSVGRYTVRFDASAPSLSIAVAEAGPEPGGLTLQGSSSLTSFNESYAQLFDSLFTLSNDTGEAVSLDQQMFFFVAPGGYAYPGPGRPSWWGPELAASATDLPAGTFGWGWSAPVSHFVVRVHGVTSGGQPASGIGVAPVLRSGFAAPEPSPYGVDPVVVGAQGPIQLVTLTSGERWLGVNLSVTDLTETATSAPVVTATALGTSGEELLNLAITPNAVHPNELPMRTFVAWTAIPTGLTVSDLRLSASQQIDRGLASQTRVLPVEEAAPVTVDSPVSGIWGWHNGPGETSWHAHSGSASGRYAYDMGIHQVVGGQLQSWSGDRAVNESYFCWGKPIRAVADGIVRYVKDDTPDNNGDLQDVGGPNNEVIIEHANGAYFTVYAHLRQGSATVVEGQTVTAGTQLGQVGNAGASSEPHLHFHAFRFDATGRTTGVPMVIDGMTSLQGAPLSGVPKSGERYQTP